MAERGLPPQPVRRGLTAEAHQLAHTLHNTVDTPLLQSIGSAAVGSLSGDADLAAQVRHALRELSPNNSLRYGRVAMSYKNFWRDAVLGKTPYPQEIEIHPSAYCPLDCWYCCSPHSYAREKISPTLRNDRLIGYVQELGGHLETVQLSGGREPLEDGTLPELLKTLADEKISIRVNTSGYSSKPGRLGAIMPFVDYTAVSIDGHTSRLYNSIKRVSRSDALERVVENVRLAVAHPKRRGVVEMVVLILPENQNHIRDLVRFAEALGFDSIRFRRLKRHVIASSLGVADPNLELNDIELLRRIGRIKPSGSSFSINVNSEDFLLGYDDYLKDNRSPCFSASRKIVIDALGYVYPCALHSYPGPEGRGISLGDPINIRDFEKFSELWKQHAPTISHYHAKPCTNCYIADRYINNFVSRLAQDDQDGTLALALDLFAVAGDGPGSGL